MLYLEARRQENWKQCHAHINISIMPNNIDVQMHNEYEAQRATRRILNRDAQSVAWVVGAFAVAVLLFILILSLL